jgi:hypothetical protein
MSIGRRKSLRRPETRAICHFDRDRSADRESSFRWRSASAAPRLRHAALHCANRQAVAAIHPGQYLAEASHLSAEPRYGNSSCMGPIIVCFRAAEKD